MATNIVVPEMGESVIEATVGKWLKHEGDRVAAGETVVELETDKVDLEVGAERAGVLARIERKEGEDVKVGDILGTIAESAEETPTPRTMPEQPAAAPPPPQAPEEKQAPTPSAAAEQAKGTPPATPNPSPEGGDGDRVTPVARRLAEEQGVDLSKVSASGPGGRVTKQDVEAYLEKQTVKPSEPAPAPAPTQPVRPAPPAQAPARPTPTAVQAPFTRADREERIRMSRRRRTIAQRLIEAQQTAAMLTTFNEVDMSAVTHIRARRKETFKEQYGVSLGFMSFFVKATIGALKAFPRLNAEIQGDEIVLKHYYDIGIAVGAEEGLVVPVLRDADRMSFAEIEREIKSLAQKAQQGTLSLEDLRGGTFTITNGGVFGSLMSTPILNTPQVGILGLHKIEERPIARNGQVVIRPMMYVALSYDHRIVDGREAVQFLVRVKELVEDPEALLLGG